MKISANSGRIKFQSSYSPRVRRARNIYLRFQESSPMDLKGQLPRSSGHRADSVSSRCGYRCPFEPSFLRTPAKNPLSAEKSAEIKFRTVSRYCWGLAKKSSCTARSIASSKALEKPRSTRRSIFIVPSAIFFRVLLNDETQ